ncbi:MAG: hypothetical protein AB2421_15960, partial [Thermotaleaceae bacterium]
VYVGFRFEFKFGVAAILALVHDILWSPSYQYHLLFQEQNLD